jgi:Tfp pilus assembly protein PilF
MIILVFIFIALSTRTIIRNLDWKDPITFYTKSLSQSPWNVPMRHNLAMTYAEKGEIDRAIKEYKILISLADVYPNTHHNLADAYKVKGQYGKAEEEYKKALKIDPNFYFSYYGLIDLYQKTGEKEKLEEIIKKIQKIQLK